MIERKVGRDRLQPTTGCGASAQLIKVLVGLKKNLLRNIFGLRSVTGNAGRRAEDHILVIAHERGEVVLGD